MEAAPVGGDDEEDEADRERQAAERLAAALAERRHPAEQQQDAADGAERLSDLTEPHTGVGLDGEREDEHGGMIASSPDGAASSC